jgi:hypothetical protein
MNTKEALMDRVGGYFEMPQRLLVEQAVNNRVALMEIFDEVFGHGGYSGVAF